MFTISRTWKISLHMSGVGTETTGAIAAELGLMITPVTASRQSAVIMIFDHCCPSISSDPEHDVNLINYLSRFLAATTIRCLPQMGVSSSL
ncbi:MAG: hypothetical protein AB8I58_11215, partial [Anaerolineales bacterium]